MLQARGLRSMNVKRWSFYQTEETLQLIRMRIIKMVLSPQLCFRSGSIVDIKWWWKWNFIEDNCFSLRDEMMVLMYKNRFWSGIKILMQNLHLTWLSCWLCWKFWSLGWSLYDWNCILAKGQSCPGNTLPIWTKASVRQKWATLTASTDKT